MSGANDMSSTLGEVFGTTKVASATPEDLEKQASVDFFNGLCQEQGINIEQLDNSQLEELWKVAMEMKAAEFPPGFAKGKGEEKGEQKEEKEGEKEKEKEAQAKLAAAESEFLQKRAAAEKVAEADAMGRIIAHSFVAELNKIASEGNLPPQFGKEKDGKEEGKEKDKKDEGKKEASAADKVAALINAFQSAKTASATAQPSGTTTPNFDEQAAYYAVELLKAASVDPQLAFDKVNAVYVLGLSESTKIASAPDLKTGIHVRALEICEAAGFPVEWPSA